MDGKIHLGLNRQLYGEVYTDPFIQDEDKLSISELIPRILHERESFLNLTEESLIKEIEAKTEAAAKEDESSQYTGDFEDMKMDLGDGEPAMPGSVDSAAGASKFDEFQAKKVVLARNIGTALNETSLSLDFVSLLISAVKPNIGKTTMSPHLSKTIPLGSLTSDRVERAIEADSAVEAASMGQGLKLESLQKVTDLFKSASTRLNEQVLKERVYWENIATVLGSGEVLYKTRNPLTGNRAIGVKYGFGDSGSNFHDKGLAVLQRDDRTGDVSLLPVLATTSGLKTADRSCKYLRVKVLSKIDDDYMLTGQSMFNPASISALGVARDGILGSIDKHRYFLFEEDLFYYLTREAKTLINYNVSIISNKIIIEVQDNIFEIESIVYDEANDDEPSNLYQNINRESSMNNGKAQQILVYFKLMLCCFFRYNLTLRQGVPTSKTKWKLANSHPLILRPFLGYIRHDINFKNIGYILSSIQRNHGLSEDQFVIATKKYLTLQPIRATKRVQDIFEKLTKSPTSEIALTIKHPKTSKVLKMDLNLGATETFCNLIVDISIVSYANDTLENGSRLLELKVSEIYDVEECLQWVVTKFLRG